MEFAKKIMIGIMENGQIFVAGKNCGGQAEIAGMLHRVAKFYSAKIKDNENAKPKIFMPWEGTG